MLLNKDEQFTNKALDASKQGRALNPDGKNSLAVETVRKRNSEASNARRIDFSTFLCSKGCGPASAQKRA